MKSRSYIALGRTASTLYLTSVTIFFGTLFAIIAAVLSPLIERFLMEYGILTALLMAATLTCLPIFFVSLVVGYFGRCPECGTPFSQASVLPNQRIPSNLESLRRCFRTAVGRECRCNACNADALRPRTGS